jgi:XTP/dITP diphosphohydrolase
VTPRLVLATANAGKVRELALLLDGLGYRIASLRDHPAVALPPEGETSYRDNALEKARAAARAVPAAVALGDDSGLEVDALGGRPGLASARYGGPGLSDAERTRRLLDELGSIAHRSARFRCVLAMIAPWGEEAVVEGTVDGVLTDAPRGTHGFGYDPIFFYPPYRCTLAEVTGERKLAVAHRGHAFRAFREWLTESSKHAFHD